jgi:hypothetical protein
MSAAARAGCEALLAAAQALIIVALTASVAAAAAAIPASELPGRERQLFIDPPGARLLDRGEPGTVLPYEAGPSGAECPLQVKRRARKGRKPRRC